MDYQIIWSPVALGDIDNIAEFHAKTDRLYAQVVLEELVVKSCRINRYPLRAGFVIELTHLGYHEMFAYIYRLIYQVIEHETYIVEAIPGKMPVNVERFTASND